MGKIHQWMLKFDKWKSEDKQNIHYLKSMSTNTSYKRKNNNESEKPSMNYLAKWCMWSSWVASIASTWSPDTRRAEGHIGSVVFSAQSPLAQPNHEKHQKNPNRGTFYKIIHQYSSKLLRSWQTDWGPVQMEEPKKIRQLSIMWGPRLDPGK